MGRVHLGPNALMMSDYGNEDSRNFEALLLDGQETISLFCDNSGTGWHTIGPVAESSYRAPALLRGDLPEPWTTPKDFEALVVDRDGEVQYVQRDNSHGGIWQAGSYVTTGCTGVVSIARGHKREPISGSSPVAVPNPPNADGTDGGLTITSTPTTVLSDHHNIEALIPKHDGLHHFTKHMGVSRIWSDNGAIAGPGAAGSLISSDYDHLEALVFEPDPDGRSWGALTLLWQDEKNQWQSGGTLQARALGPPGFIQSDYVRDVDHHNFEALVAELDEKDRPILRHWVRDNSKGVGSWTTGGSLFPELLPTGQVSLIQGNMGDQEHHGNFEALVVVDSGQVVHLWRDAHTMAWRIAGPMYP